MDKNEGHKIVTARFSFSFFAGTAVLLSTVLIFFWGLKDSYFSDISANITHFVVLMMTLTIFGLGHLIFVRRLNGHLEEEMSQLQSQKLNFLENKVTLLEQRLAENKNEGTKKAAPNEKLSLITQERVFIHDISNKIQIVQGVVSNLLEYLETAEIKDKNMLAKQLQMAQRNLDAMINLVKENREFLIIAS